jgi:AcrR family transcriptional regulator
MNHSAVRDRILDVASRLFFEQGYNNTGINQIIEEAEIARASLYHHFPSKTELLNTYLREADEKWFIRLNAFLAPIRDPRKKILGLFDYRINRQLANNFGGCHFIKISAEVAKGDDQVFELVARHKNRFKEYIKSILTQVKSNKDNLLSTNLLAETLFLLIEGATVSVTINKDPQALQTAKKIAEKLL